MGHISHFDLTTLAGAFACDHEAGTPFMPLRRRPCFGAFIETGTGTGSSLVHAFQHADLFRLIYSCEINPVLAARAAAVFPHHANVGVACMESDEFLSMVLPGLTPAVRDQPLLFWLDAHFPGADYGLAQYDDPTVPSAVRLPLHVELGLIRALRPDRAARDVILIDDARIWLDLAPDGTPFANGPLLDSLRPICPVDRSIAFIHDMFGATHDIAVDPTDEGYIVLTPIPASRKDVQADG